MQTNKLMLAVLAIGIAVAGCEIPKKPDFTTSHKVEAPVLYNKTYQFMGDSTALIDTTSGDLDSLFTVNGTNNFITISKEQDFEFGDLNDAVPVVSVDPTEFESQVGEIELTDFSSGNGDLGSANIEEVTGSDPNVVPAGTPIPAGNNAASPVRIGIGANTDFFQSATVKSGAMVLQLSNTLGFDFETATIQVIDTLTNTPIGSAAQFSAANGNQLQDGDTETASINFSEGDELRNLGVEITVSWQNFAFPADPEALTVNSVQGENLVVSEVQAALDEQDFSTTSTATFGDEEFEFTSPNHFVQLETGRIIVAPVENEMEFRITMEIIFTDIRECPAALVGNNFVTNNNPLTIDYSGNERIRRANGGVSGFSPEANISLAGCKLYATNNEVAYTISATTENTKDAAPGDQVRVINETQSISSSVEISNLQIQEATGIVKQQIVLLNDEDPADTDDNLDLFNDNEAELTEIDGLSDLSSQLDGLNFTNPRLSINYTSNITVPTTIYGAFVGINGEGEQRFLRGLAGEQFEVLADDPIDGLQIRGQDLLPEQMIKFTLDTPANPGDEIVTSLEFNRNNTSVVNFLNNLPSEIRFIGKAVVNEDEDEVTILNNLSFTPKIAIDIPLAFSTETAATFTDTSKNDLGDLPSQEKGDDTFIKNGSLVIDYVNGLPLSVNLVVTFMDSLKNEITSIPQGADNLGILAAGINDDTRFANDPTPGSIEISLTEAQINDLYKTRFLKVSASLITTDNTGNGEGDNIRLRTTDFITLSLRAELNIESQVGGN
jgi:hypothetical protein